MTKPTETSPRGHIDMSRQTSLIMRILAFNSPIQIGASVASYFLLSTVADSVRSYERLRLGRLPLRSGFWQKLCHGSVFIVMAAGSIAVAATFFPMKTKIQQKQPTQRRSWKRLDLCLVTKGENRSTVIRSVHEMKPLLSIDPRIRFVVLTEQGRDFQADLLGVDVVFVPQDYQPRLARYKARALEYFRVDRQLANDDWVLHLDEETSMDSHGLLSCINFIENTSYEWGQGIIMYNTVNYWSSPLLTFAEVLRFRDDLGRFQLQHGCIHYTVWGCHGSFLITSGRVENSVTWETPCLAEDFWFADRACQAGFGGGFVPSIAREQNNFTIRDFLRQRRRWFCGMWQVGKWGRLMVVTWILSTMEVPLVVLSWLGRVRLPGWLTEWMHIYFSSNAATGLVALLFQELDASTSVPKVLWHLLMTPVLSFGVQCLQSTVVLYSICWPPTGFDIVQKQ